ncbi:MAG: hypothetical protein WCT49_00300 [Candidatus Paceibacterota bacterium]|nr:hypothetical protein [Candidatus Paceibacterota bacterium]
MNELYELPREEDMRQVLEMYKELAPATLYNFLSHKNAHLLEIIGKSGAEAVISRIEKSKNVFVLSHDLVLNCIIREMFPPLEELAIHTSFAECGAMEIVVYKGEKLKAKIIT